MRLPLSISTKLTLLFVLFAALLLVGVGALAYINGRAALEAATIADLLSTAIEKEAALNAWVEDRQANLAALSHSSTLNEDVAALVAAAPTSATAQAAHDRLVRELQTWAGPGQQYLTLLVIAAETGQVIAATDPAEEGKFKEDRPFFINGKNGPYTQNLYYSIGLQDLSMTAAAPFRSANGRLLAVLAGRLNLADMNDIINRRTGLHQTDDTLLVNTSSLYVTQPRFLTDPVVLRRGVHTEPVQRCLARSSGVVSADDYRGVPAIAVYRWLVERQLCLIVKIDQAEALASTRAFGRTILIMGGLVLLAASILAVALARTITGPVKQLMAGARELGSGKLDTRFEITTGDELEQLAGAFTQMAADLQQTLVSRDELLKEVTERKLAEEQFRLVVEASPNAIMLVSPAGKIHLVNVQAETLFGYTREELLGQAIELLVPPQFHDQHHHDRDIFFNAPQARPMGAGRDLFGWRKDGSLVPLEVGLAPITTSEGAFVLTTAVDITKRKQAEETLRESEDRFKYIFDHSIIGKSITFPSGELHVNQAFCDMLGYSSEELQHQSWQDITHPEDIEPTQSVIEPLFSGEKDAVRFIKRYIHKNGSVVWADVSTFLRRDNDDQPLYFMTSVSDITERKHAEEEILQLNAELEQRVLERTAQLEAANKELEAFAYSVSHDLRAPLRGIDGFSQALLEDYADKLNEEGRRYLQRVRAASQRMAELIDDLLTLSRLTRSQMRYEPVNLTLLAQTIAEELRKSEPDRRVEFNIAPGLVVTADARLMRIALENLLGNAWKYTAKHPSARIELGLLAQVDGKAAYFVRDDGAGFDMAYAGKLFGAFQRLHTLAEFAGNGIGLATVQRIIHRHGGQVWAEGAVEQGATFYFTL